MGHSLLCCCQVAVPGHLLCAYRPCITRSYTRSHDLVMSSLPYRSLHVPLRAPYFCERRQLPETMYRKRFGQGEGSAAWRAIQDWLHARGLGSAVFRAERRARKYGRGLLRAHGRHGHRRHQPCGSQAGGALSSALSLHACVFALLIWRSFEMRVLAACRCHWSVEVAKANCLLRRRCRSLSLPQGLRH